MRVYFLDIPKYILVVESFVLRVILLNIEPVQAEQEKIIKRNYSSWERQDRSQSDLWTNYLRMNILKNLI